MKNDGMSLQSARPASSTRIVRACAVAGIAMVISLGTGRADQSSVAPAALNLINELTAANRSAFCAYKDSDSGFNHGFPSGWFANSPAARAKIHLDMACVYDPASANGCTVAPNRLDWGRGTV